MAKDIKYFTPLIEDIRVGYECEIPSMIFQNETMVDWRSYVLKHHDLKYYFGELKEEDLLKRIRVPYLTKEQIEAEGWIQESPSPNGYLYYFTKVVGGNGEYNKWGHYEGTRYFLKYYKNNKWLAPLEISQLIPEIPDERGSREYRSDPLKFDCKDINTFRYICKLLRINEKATNNSTSPE